MPRLVVFGLAITSAWGNGHATTYRGLLAALARRGWEVVFVEKDVKWYRNNRDLAEPAYCDVRLYEDWRAARAWALDEVGRADAVLVGSYAGDAVEWIDALAGCGRPLLYYDIDTPVTLTALAEQGAAEYLRRDQVPLFDVYFSFTGGPAVRELERRWGARRAEPLYCGVDPEAHRLVPSDLRFECQLGYMGTYAADRQPTLEKLLIEPARRTPERRFLIAGPMYPAMELPPNVDRIDHVYPPEHAAFYMSNWATLNLTRAAMVRYGWSPSVRLFEAAACGACIVSDVWPGIEELLAPGREILLAREPHEVLAHLAALTPGRRAAIGTAARERILAEHTYEQRAEQFERVYRDVAAGRPAPAAVGG